MLNLLFIGRMSDGSGSGVRLVQIGQTNQHEYLTGDNNLGSAFPFPGFSRTYGLRGSFVVMLRQRIWDMRSEQSIVSMQSVLHGVSSSPVRTTHLQIPILSTRNIRFTPARFGFVHTGRVCRFRFPRAAVARRAGRR